MNEELQTTCTFSIMDEQYSFQLIVPMDKVNDAKYIKGLIYEKLYSFIDLNEVRINHDEPATEVNYNLTR